MTWTYVVFKHHNKLFFLKLRWQGIRFNIFKQLSCNRSYINIEIAIPKSWFLISTNGTKSLPGANELYRIATETKLLSTAADQWFLGRDGLHLSCEGADKLANVLEAAIRVSSIVRSPVKQSVVTMLSAQYITVARLLVQYLTVARLLAQYFTVTILSAQYLTIARL